MAAVVVAAVIVVAVVAAAARALDLAGDPAAGGTTHGRLDPLGAGLQGRERDALEAGRAGDADRDRPALGVAEAEGAVVAVDRDDGSLELGRGGDRGGGEGRDGHQGDAEQLLHENTVPRSGSGMRWDFRLHAAEPAARGRTAEALLGERGVDADQGDL